MAPLAITADSKGRVNDLTVLAPSGPSWTRLEPPEASAAASRLRASGKG